MRSHRIQDIADQSGLSAATVDRVLHHRAGVSARAVRAVEQAVLELDRQQAQLRLGAQTLMLEVVMQAPARFSSAVQQALESELGAHRPRAIRARFRLTESGTATHVAGLLRDIGQRGRTCHGVLLKATDDPEIAAAVGSLYARGIPVVTLVTDVRDCPRIAYVGADNRAAGATAAYLVGRWSRRRGTALVTLSRSTFFGERERAESFVATLATEAPGLRVVQVGETDGLDEPMAPLIRDALAHHPDIRAVYSVGGGNTAIRAELDRAGVRPVHLAHDLDRDNRALLQAGHLDAVLEHDLSADMQAAVRQVLRHHGLAPGAPASVPATVHVVTPYNMPSRLTPS